MKDPIDPLLDAWKFSEEEDKDVRESITNKVKQWITQKEAEEGREFNKKIKSWVARKKDEDDFKYELKNVCFGISKNWMNSDDQVQGHLDSFPVT